MASTTVGDRGTFEVVTIGADDSVEAAVRHVLAEPGGLDVSAPNTGHTVRSSADDSRPQLLAFQLIKPRALHRPRQAPALQRPGPRSLPRRSSGS